jgi:hypothetical protein
MDNIAATLVRADDLLPLGIECINVTLQAGETPKLTRTTPAEAFIVVQLALQNNADRFR